MYHQQVISQRLDRLADGIRRDLDPDFVWRDTPIGEIEERCAALNAAFDPAKETLTRGLFPHEIAFMRHEVHRCKVDAPYFLTHYAMFKNKDMELQRFVFWDSQAIILDHIARAELAALKGTSGDGIVLAILKARQLGASTLTEGLISHRTFFYGYSTALVAAHIPEQTAYLFDMMERVYENLPWWMRPARTYHVKNSEMFFEGQDSLVFTGSGRSTVKGGDENRGAMGTGRTITIAHLSELALWDNPWQIDDSLMPSIPERPRTFVIFESTAKGRGNWWHKQWTDSVSGVKRTKPVFIPWYAEAASNTRPAPEDWKPSEDAIDHACRAEEVSAQWCGRTYHLTRNQLYWWECKRQEYLANNTLNKFLAEYCAEPEEAFQHTTASVIDAWQLHQMRQKLREPVLVEVVAKTEMAKHV